MTRSWKIALAASAILVAQAGIADAAAPYYEGKRITLTISNTPGGGMDGVARTVAALLNKYIPGKPTVIVVNRPGAGHVIGNNWLQELAARDGTDMLYTASSIIDVFNEGGERIKFNPQKYEFVGAIKYASSVVMVRNDAEKRVRDPKAPAVVVGDTDGARVHTATTVMAKRYLGDNFRWVVGYKGGNELVLALEKGEIDVWGSKNQGEIDKLTTSQTKVAKVLYQSGLIRRSDYADVPTIWELIAAKNVPEIERKAFDFWMGGEPLDHIMALPPGTNPEAVKIVREAYLSLSKDPEWLRQVEAINGSLIIPISGPETLQIMINATTTDERTQKALADIRNEYGLRIAQH
jgi:tripartite-type tricarboxylate transporter receptor subunit TctC